MTLTELTNDAIFLLKKLIETESFSSHEDRTASLIEDWFKRYEVDYKRTKNNVWARNKNFDESKPTLLLNSHHDTVKPNAAYTKDPFKAIVEDGKLYGLGSNDAGGCLVSLIAVFTYFYNESDLKYNLVIVASAEEESSGPDGLNSMLSVIPKVDVAIVGEPTLMNLAIAEKGLVVFDAVINSKMHPLQLLVHVVVLLSAMVGLGCTQLLRAVGPSRPRARLLPLRDVSTPM